MSGWNLRDFICGSLFSSCTLTLLAGALLLFAGASCSSTDAEKVNEMVITLDRFTPTTDKDFLQSKNSRLQLEARGEDYRVGPGDVLEINIFELEKRDEFKTVEARVEESGEITIPIAGSLVAGGLTVDALVDVINRRLVEGEFIKSPRTNVTIKEFRSKKIAVVGAVEKPGEYMIRQNVTTLLDALGMAGGPTDQAGYELYVVKASNDLQSSRAGLNGAGGAMPNPGFDENTIAVDLITLMEEGALELNVALGNGDVVFVPRAKKFYVVGFVRRPGGFPLNQPMTVLEGIAMAEGLMEREASPSECALKRLTRGQEEIIPLDLVAIAMGEKPNFFLQPDDVIDVRQTAWRFVGLELLDFFKRIFHFGYDLNPARRD